MSKYSIHRLSYGINKYRWVTMGHFHRVPIRFHWSALVLGLIIILMTVLGGLQILALGVALFGLMIAHEIGHAVLAEYFKREVLEIDIYFIVGLCSYGFCDDPYEESVIAWGGILVQLLLFIPAALILSITGVLLPKHLT